MNCLSPLTLKNPRFGKLKPNSVDPEPRFLEVPCGKCAACLMSYRRDWIVRLKKEADASVYSIFVTLTYADEFIPACGVSKEDVQAFFARLRDKLKKRYGIKVRYYITSEYGPTTFRPHYHALLFFDGFVPEVASVLLEAWQKGFVYVGTVESRSIGYCASYHITKGGYPKGQNKPFVLMSRRPGIGGIYLRNECNVYYHMPRLQGFDSDPVFTVPVGDGISCHMPRFYRDKLFSKKEIEQYKEDVKAQLDAELYGVKKSDYKSSQDFYRVVDSRIRAYLRYFDKMKVRNHKL